jgi:cobalt/nickel transport system permease protein
VHIPDGFFDAPTSVVAGGIAVAGVAYCLRRAEGELDDRLAPLAGLTAAFVFAVQMLNFPVAAGTSGHLIGGALAATLVGPAAAALCLTVVLLVQAMFADGGLTALGLNVTIVGLVPAFVGYAAVRAALVVLPRTTASVPLAAGIGGLLSVPAAALLFVGAYALGGAGDVPLGTVLAAMVGVHLLIGVGEGLITAAAVGAVIATRPDLVHAARGLRRPAAPAAPREAARR